MTKRMSVASAVLAGWAIALAVLLLMLTPAALAHHSADHDKGKGHNASQGEGQGNGRGGDRDGDADSDPNTAHEDSHEPEPDATPSDNKHPSGKDKSGEPGGSGNQGKAESDPDDDGRGPDRTNGGPDKPGGSGGVDRDDQDGNNGCGNDDDFEDDNEGLCLGRQGPKGDNGRNGGNGGNGSADMTIDVDCDSVTVTSSKDISFVEVTFADGTTVKFEGLTGTEFFRSFDAPLASARAKSATTIVSDRVDEVCDEDEVGGGLIEKPGFPDDRRPPTDIVLGERLTNEAAPDVEADVLTAPPAEEGAVLPFTGGGIASILLTALALLTAGGLLARHRT